MLRLVFGRYDRELTCARCRGVIAFVRTRPFSLLKVQHVDGYDISPHGTTVAVRIEQARLARLQREREAVPELVGDSEVEEVHRRLAYLKREAGEVVYEFVCPCGATHLRSLPDLSRAIRRAEASRVELRG